MGGTSTQGGSGTESSIKIVANIFISFIGAGVLGLPYAFKESGVMEGCLIMVCVSVISIKAMLMLIDCKYKVLQDNGPLLDFEVMVPLTNDTSSMANGIDTEDVMNKKMQFQNVQSASKNMENRTDLTYSDLGFVAMGAAGRSLVDICLLISQIGFCCAYLIFISENLSTYIHSLEQHHWLFLLLPPLYLLTLLRSLSSLAMSSLFAQVSNLFAFVVVFWFDFDHIYKVRTHPREWSLEGFPFFFAIAIYCYEGAGMILSLEASLLPKVRHHFKRYFVMTMVAVTTLYVTFGACGYLSFGAETMEIITLNLPHEDHTLDFAMLVKLSLCLSLYFTYPVMMFPVVELLEKRLFRSVTTLSANILRFVLVVLTGVIVLAVPNFANLMALVGATCCMLLAFILPGVFHMKIFNRSLKANAMFYDIFLIVIGIIGTVIGTLDAFKRMQVDHLEKEGIETNTLDKASDVLMESVMNKTMLINNATAGDEASDNFSKLLKNFTGVP